MSISLDIGELIDVNDDNTLEDELSWLYTSPSAHRRDTSSGTSSLHDWVREPLDSPQKGAVGRVVHSLTFQLDGLSKGSTPIKQPLERAEPHEEVLAEGHARVGLQEYDKSSSSPSIRKGTNCYNTHLEAQESSVSSSHYMEQRGDDAEFLDTAGYTSPSPMVSTSNKSTTISRGRGLSTGTFTRPKGSNFQTFHKANSLPREGEINAGGDRNGRPPVPYMTRGQEEESSPPDSLFQKHSNEMMLSAAVEANNEDGLNSSRDILANTDGAGSGGQFDSSTFTRPIKAPSLVNPKTITHGVRGGHEMKEGSNESASNRWKQRSKGWKSMDGGLDREESEIVHRLPDLADIQALARLQEQSLRESFNNVRKVSLNGDDNFEDGEAAFTVHHHQYKNKSMARKPSAALALSPRGVGSGRVTLKPKSGLQQPSSKRSGIPSPRGVSRLKPSSLQD